MFLLYFQGLHTRNVQTEKLSDDDDGDDDVPSASPFCAAAQEIKRDNEQSPSRIHRTQHKTSSSDQFVRYVYYFNASSFNKWHPIMLICKTYLFRNIYP